MANPEAFARVKAIAESDDDQPVVMLNLNRYTDEAGFPHGPAYVDYLHWLDHAVQAGGGRVLWRTPVSDQVIGCGHDDVDEILAVWYPSHASFVALRHADGADQMFAGRATCVESSIILSLPADRDPLRPSP